jgi:hypothetical protein
MPPDRAQAVPVQSHLRSLYAVVVTGQTCSSQPRRSRSASTVAEASCHAAHPRRPARLALSIFRRAARHLAERTVAEPSASSHEVFTLRLGLKSEHAAGPAISPS